MADLNLLYTVPIGDKWLLHAPLLKWSALVNGSLLSDLKRGRLDPLKEDYKKLCQLLEGKPNPVPTPNTGSLKPEFLGLIPTRACNLNCIYCGFGSAQASSTDHMNLTTATTAVDWMAQLCRQEHRDVMEIHFFGGEPFVSPDVVDTVVHHARFQGQKTGLMPRFEVSTNGFFSEERCRFIGDYFDTVILSIDGPPDIQNQLRPAKDGQNCYQRVARNASMLGESPAELCLRACITADTVDRMEEITQWFCQKFTASVITYEPVREIAYDKGSGPSTPDPWQFSRQYIKSKKIAQNYGITPVYAAAAIDQLRHSFCPMGRDTAIVSPEGKIHACYLQEREWQAKRLNLTFGEFNGSGSPQLDQTSINTIRALSAEKDKCRRCFCRWHCAGGCHVATPDGQTGWKYHDFCIQTRIITACELLQKMGRTIEVDNLLHDLDLMQRLAFQDSDFLTDWEV